MSPYEVLFGYVPTPLQIASMPGPVIPDPAEYSAILKQRKLYNLRENWWKPTLLNQQSVNSSIKEQPDLPTAQAKSKGPTHLSPHWTGSWTLLCMKSPTTVRLKMAAASRLVHINRVHPLMLEEDKDHQASPNWVPPLFTHEEIRPNEYLR